MSTLYLILIRCISRLFGCMSLGFIARGYGSAAPSTRLMGNSSCIIGRPSLIRVCWVLFGAWLLGRSNYVCIWLAKFPSLLCIKVRR